MAYDRRRFLVAAGGASALAACGRGEAPAATGEKRYEWRLATSWSRDFPGFADAARRLAASITSASGNRLRITAHAAGDPVPAFEVFDAVSRGDVQMGHSASYYWKAKSRAMPFFCAIPFGLNAQEMNAWLYRGGGLELWRALYAKFDLVPFAVGNTGVQLAGWFNREISTLADLRGLKMRIPGLGGEVVARVGVTPVNLAADEIVAAMAAGTIDACEWMGPANDLAFGLQRVSKHCYFPGWQEPGSTLELMVHKPAFDALPADLKAIVETCCQAVNEQVLADFTQANERALETLAKEHGVKPRRLPGAVLSALAKASADVVENLVGDDADARRVYDAYRAFRERARSWHAISEVAYYQARG